VPSGSRDRGGEQQTLISVAQAAAQLGVHPNTIRAWTDAGRIPAYRINARGDRRFRPVDVERLLAEGSRLLDAPVNPEGSMSQAQIAVLGRLAQGVGGPSQAAACRVTIDALRTHLGYDRVAVYLQSDGVLRLETHAGYRLAPPSVLDLAAGLKHLGRAPTQPHEPVDEAWLPLRAGSEHLGLLTVSCDEATLDEGHQLFLGSVASALGAAVHSARLLARARRELSRSRSLRAITQELTGQLDLAAVLDEIVDRSRGLFDADKVGLWLVTEAERPFQLAASRGIGDAFQARVRGLTLDSTAVGVQAVLERRTHVVPHASSEATVGDLREVYAAEEIETACLVPLVESDRTVGVIGLYHTKPHHWPQDELDLAQALANQAAVAISNARLYRSVADQAARMRSIQDLSARLNRLTDERAIAEAIVAEASTLAEYHDIRVYAVDWEARMCEPIAYTDRLLGQGNNRERLRVEVGPGSFTGMVAETGEPLLINDALADQRGHTIEGTDDIDESMLVVPMVYEGRAVGVLALSKLGVNQFSTDDLQTMSIFAGYAAQAIANARSYEQLARQSTELARRLQSQRRLLEINERLLSTFDPKHVLELIADGLRSVVFYDNLSIYRADHAKKVMHPVLTRERHQAAVARYIIPFGRGLMGWAVEHAEAVLANDALNDPRAMQIPGTPADPEALCVVPLLSDGLVIGSLNIGRIGNEEAYFSTEDFELIKLFAAQASTALRNAEEHQAVSLRAETDALTELGNHGAFQGYLAHVMETVDDEAGRPHFSLLMMDLDRFKDYNDRLGHPAGDALLRAIGQVLTMASRSGDRVFRYGGDEFTVVLSEVEPADAALAADRIRRAVARLTAGEASPVTITVGIANYPSDARDKNALITAADTALYYGKQAGENRVIRIADVPREMRALRGTLDQLARAALLHPEEAGAMEHLVEQAARLGSGVDDEASAAMREAVLAVARAIEAPREADRRHAARVSRLARSVAERLGCPPHEVDVIELAARLHGLEIDPQQLAGVRPLRGVGEILRAERRLIAGSRRRDRGPISLGAEIVAAANAYDAAGGRRSTSATDAADRLAATAERAPSVRAEVRDALAATVGAGVRTIPAGRRRGDRAGLKVQSDGRPAQRGAA
jgi:diguanylate cyclase (GGDEF)-like protein/excisionase family DNA binding protein